MPANGLQAKIDLTASTKVFDYSTFVLFRRDNIDTKMISSGSMEKSENSYNYTENLLINDRKIYDFESSISNPAEVPFKLGYRLLVPSMQPFELAATSQFDRNENILETSVCTLNNLNVCALPSISDNYRDKL